jgi:Uma2 family endonuclease
MPPEVRTLMSTTSPRQRRGRGAGKAGLDNGDRMKQADFHHRYEQCPEDTKFELVGGTVYMSSPVRWPHANYHLKLGVALEVYASGTPGVEAGDNATAILGADSEPQADLTLRLLPEYGGQSKLDGDRYVTGPPELLAEIAHSSRAIDLHQKREDYRKAGIIEYIVLCLEEQELHWFHFPSRGRIKPDRQGTWRSKVFPGLWLDGQALLQRNSSRILEVVQHGLASRAHAAFVKRLQTARRRSP